MINSSYVMHEQFSCSKYCIWVKYKGTGTISDNRSNKAINTCSHNIEIRLQHSMHNLKFWLLQQLQYQYAKFIIGANIYDNARPILNWLHWLSRLKHSINIITFKALHGLSPSYLRDMLIPFAPLLTLRSSDIKINAFV